MKNCILGLCAVLAFATMQAQSYHFSQFFSTPLLINPANTGFTEGPYRVATNMRSQGQPGGNAYFTGYLSADVSPLRKYLPVGHKAGLGLYVMNDRSLTGAAQTNAIGISAAYNVGLDPDGEQSIGAGFQGVYQNRRLDYSKLTFENQYGPTGYNPNLPPGELLDFVSNNFFDVNAGVLYNVNLEDKSFFAGISVYNILQHDESLLNDGYKMPSRFVLQGGAQFFIGESAKLYGSLTTMTQAGATETTFGGAYGLQLTEGEKNELMGGLWYRYKDAFIPYLGYQRGPFQVGLSYDYTVSDLKMGARIRNGYELTLIYKAIDKQRLKTLIPWY